jgi:hypothetical protein
MTHPIDADYRAVFGDPPATLDPEHGLNLPVVPNIDILSPPIASLSPLVEFQYALTTLLYRELAAQPGYRVIADSQLSDALLEAVQAVTAHFWHVKRISTLIRDANGVVHDGMSYGGTIAPDPVTSLYGLTVSARYARALTGDEQHAQERRHAALIWSVGDGATPPPAGVGVTTLLEQDVWWKPAKADPIRLDDMAVTHQANMLDWLYRRAQRFHEREIGQFASLLSGPLGPSGDGAVDGAEREFDQLCEQDAVTWMGEQPLARRLAKLIRRASVRPVCRYCHRSWTRKLRRSVDCVSPSNQHGPWVLPDVATSATDAAGSTENTVRTPTNDDIDHGVRVRVFPGPHHGAPDVQRNHGIGCVTWITRNVDPTKTRFGVAIDSGGTSEAGLSDVELLDEDGEAPMELIVTDGGDGGPGMWDINAAFVEHAPADDPDDGHTDDPEERA